MGTIMKYSVGILVFSVTTEVLWQLWKKYIRKKRDNEHGTINEVLIFNEQSPHCREHACKLISCGLPQCPGSNIKKLVDHLDSSKKTLDLCIYILTYRDLSDAIIRAHNRHVTVRFIVDAAMSDNGGCFSQLKRIRRAGIKVRMRRSTVSLMHHKFAIIDEKIVIFGSTNWTMQAFFGNYDGIQITNQKNIVRTLLDEFNRMWRMMDVTEPLISV